METLEAEPISTSEARGHDLIPIGDLSALEKRIESGLAAYQRILGMAIKYTHTGDWANLGGKPYLMSPGAERIARPFGVWVSKPTIWREDRDDAKGKYYIYFCQATVGSKLLDASLDVEGSCDSRDKFFATESDWQGEGQDRKKKTILKPIEDVSEKDIRKKAYTNMFVNGVTRLLGLRQLRWDFLEKQGILKKDVVGVEYEGKGGKGGTKTATDAQQGLLKGKAAKASVGDFDEWLKEKHNIEGGVAAIPMNKVNDIIADLDLIIKETATT